MSEAAGYGPAEQPQYTLEEERSIAHIATTQGAITGEPMKMADLFANYFRMVRRDAGEMTMHLVASKDEEPVAVSVSTPPVLNAEALNMANLALQIVERGGEEQAEFYIGEGSAVQELAARYLPLVIEQRRRR